MVPLNATELALMSSMRAVICVKPVTTPASKLTINPILVMACGFACSSSAFIVPLHDNVKTSALMGEAQQINVRVTNSIRDMAEPPPRPTHRANGLKLPVFSIERRNSRDEFAVSRWKESVIPAMAWRE